MSDERLRMIAEVQDKFSGPLGDLNKKLKDIRGAPGTAAMRKDFEAVRDSIGKTARDIRTTLEPQLSSLGVTSLGVVGAIGGVAAAIKAFAGNANDLRILSKETGFTVRSLQEFQALGARFGMSTDAMGNNLKTFGGHMREFAQNSGQAFAAWRTLDLADAADRVNTQSRSIGEALQNVLREVAKIENGDLRRKALAAFGLESFAPVVAQGVQEVERLFSVVGKNIRTLTDKEIAAAHQLEDKFHDLREKLKALHQEMSGPATVALNGFIAGLEKVGQEPSGAPAIRQLMDDIKGWIEQTDWEKAGREFGASFLSGVRDVRDALAQVERGLNTINDFISGGGGVGRWIGGKLGTAGDPNWKPDPNAGFFDMPVAPGSVLDKLKKHDGANEPGVGPQAGGLGGGAEFGAPPASAPPTVRDHHRRDRARRGLDEIREEIARVQREKGTMEAIDTDRARRRVEELNQRLKELTEELRKGREQPAISPQSMEGGGSFGGARVQHAAIGLGGSLRGFGRGGGGGGSDVPMPPPGSGGVGGAIRRERGGGGPVTVPGYGVPAAPGRMPPTVGGMVRAEREAADGRGAPRGPGWTPNARAFYEGMKAGGLGEVQRAAGMGSAQQESGFNPNAWNRGEGAGGIIQWRFNRLAALRKFAASRGETGMGSAHTQGLFFALEAQGKTAHLGSDESRGSRAFLAAQSVAEASRTLHGNIRWGHTGGRHAFSQQWAGRMREPLQPPAPAVAASRHGDTLMGRTRAAISADRQGLRDALARSLPGAAPSPVAPNPGWFDDAMKRTSAAQKIEGDATLRVKFQNAPPGMRTDTSMSGLFTRSEISRTGRAMDLPEGI